MFRLIQALILSSVCATALSAAAQPSEADDSAPPETNEAAEGESEPESFEESETPEDGFSETDDVGADTEEPAPPPTTDEGSAASAKVGIGVAAEAGELEATSETEDSAPQASLDDADETAADETTGDKPDADGWNTFVSGYFRAPVSIGISPRTGPDNPDGEPSQQWSYGPNRTFDSNYFSFAYTRLQEQEWAELFIHAKKKHVEAVVGWMGYWYQSAGFRNYDASWAPGMAYLVLDTDVDVGDLKPNVALTAGAWWPKFGIHHKYDTYTLGLFRQVGEQLKLTVPFGDFTATLTQGFGTSRDGSFNILAPPPYQAKVGLNLLHYENIALAYKDYVEVSAHYNTQWTRDPNLFPTTQPGKAYSDAVKGELSTLGGEITLRAPVAGSLWVSPSYIEVTNGWALADAGIEVMHSLSADGLATNYLAWSGSLSDSTGSGSMLNVGFVYENSLSNVLGQPRGTVPDLKFSAFGLLADITLDLPEESIITQERIGQFKYGADLEYQALTWLSAMVRWDEVNYNMDHPGYKFSAITGRLTFSSHFMSGESFHLQYSRYRYGDAMTLAGKWPWGTQLVAGSDIIQGGPYANEKPDMDVINLMATARF